jgi:hypothetical protein
LPRAVETNLDEPNLPKVAGLHELPRTVETKLEEQNIPEVAGFVAAKNPYVTVVAFAKHMKYNVVSFLFLYFAVYMQYCSLLFLYLLGTY